MKKLFIISILLISSIVSNATDLKGIFSELSKVPNIVITEKEAPETVIFDNETYESGVYEVAGCKNLDSTQIRKTGNAVYNILNSVPLTDMIIGANNNQSGVFIYTTPKDDDYYDMLLVLMSGYLGNVTIIYNTINKATLQSLQEASVCMQGSSLSVIPNRKDTIYIGGINKIIDEGPK